MGKKLTTMLMATAILLASAILQISCGGDAADTSSTGAVSKNPIAGGAEDRATRIAAQSSLRNAQMAEESYFAENQTYPASFSELKTMDNNLNPKIKVIKGSSSGYEISMEASDSEQTVYIVRKDGSKTEHVEANGNTW